MSRRTTFPLLALLLASALLHLAVAARPAGVAPAGLSADSYLSVSDEEMAAALAEPAVRCVLADTASGCAEDPSPADPPHPDPPPPASATPGA